LSRSAKLESGAFIEIWVWRGGTAALIATQARDLGLKDKIYACNTFSGVVKAGQEDPDYAGSLRRLWLGHDAGYRSLCRRANVLKDRIVCTTSTATRS
jgi:hypothetical protein